jgi:hypothetical protein
MHYIEVTPVRDNHHTRTAGRQGSRDNLGNNQRAAGDRYSLFGFGDAPGKSDNGSSTRLAGGIQGFSGIFFELAQLGRGG